MIQDLKDAKSLISNPDGGDYPFVASFATKDSANQQEFHLKSAIAFGSKKIPIT